MRPLMQWEGGDKTGEDEVGAGVLGKTVLRTARSFSCARG